MENPKYEVGETVVLRTNDIKCVIQSRAWDDRLGWTYDCGPKRTLTLESYLTPFAPGWYANPMSTFKSRPFAVYSRGIYQGLVSIPAPPYSNGKIREINSRGGFHIRGREGEGGLQLRDDVVTYENGEFYYFLNLQDPSWAGNPEVAASDIFVFEPTWHLVVDWEKQTASAAQTVPGRDKFPISAPAYALGEVAVRAATFEVLTGAVMAQEYILDEESQELLETGVPTDRPLLGVWNYTHCGEKVRAEALSPLWRAVEDFVERRLAEAIRSHEKEEHD